MTAPLMLGTLGGVWDIDRLAQSLCDGWRLSGAHGDAIRLEFKKHKWNGVLIQSHSGKQSSGWVCLACPHCRYLRHIYRQSDCSTETLLTLLSVW